MEQKIVDVFVMEQVMEEQFYDYGQAVLADVIEDIEARGYSFGIVADLLDLAKKQKAKSLIGRIKDKNGKRKYVSSQGTLDFGEGYVYLPAVDVKSKKEKKARSLEWIYKHIMGALNGSPLIPQEIANSIAQYIKDEFAKLSA